MNRITAAIAAVALSLLGTGAASADKWTMLQEMEVSIGYGPSETESRLSVTCSAGQSEIYVITAPGTKPPAQAPELVVKEGGTTNAIKLEANVCGQPARCMHRPDGEVPTYVARTKSKAMALRFAEKMESAEIDAPGAKLSVTADRPLFKKFAAACRAWK